MAFGGVGVDGAGYGTGHGIGAGITLSPSTCLFPYHLLTQPTQQITILTTDPLS